ncbi:phosphatidate cytidylyltransferase [Phaeovulum sp.]|uniref:phosphatidate cytidylyltransferase n=1 Tax=Phaeovulum sp. TaxID=2934796 RepID=UPI0039E61D4C
MNGRWADLQARSLSAVGMIAAGGAAIWWGGVWFSALSVLVTGLMVWELARMTAPARVAEARVSGLLAAGALVFVLYTHSPYMLAALLLPSVLGLLTPRRDRIIFALYALAVMLTGYGLVAFRDARGLEMILWIVAVVVASDIAGYFVGRIVGGPKFWPRVSPKKTWSGTVAGWFLAVVVGWAFVAMGQAGGALIALSPLVAFAGQMGDIAESAIKRRCGIKDSSNLIPGHGGVLDRFDALLGAVVVLLAVGLFLPLPQVGG